MRAFVSCQLKKYRMSHKGVVKYTLVRVNSNEVCFNSKLLSQTTKM